MTSTAIANNVPDDIWHIVAENIDSRAEILSLISVNRAFFNIALDVRYSAIKWVVLDEETLWLLNRLQEPMISCHVRRLYIRAWFIEFLLKKERLKRKPGKNSESLLKKLKNSLGLTSKMSSAAPTEFSSLPSQVEINITRRPLRFKDDEDVQRYRKMLSNASSTTNILSAMVNAVHGMINVSEYNFDWRDLPLNLQTQVFLTSARNTFNSTLRKLVLRAQISKFERLLAITDFDGLEELELHFDYTIFTGEALAHNDKDEDVLLATVVPFINHRSPSLRCLLISSTANVDLSSFFRAFGHFPRLQYLSMRISFDTDHLSDPSTLLRFFKTHKSLFRKVELVPNCTENTIDRSVALTLKRQAWTSFANQLLSDSSLEYLDSLTIPCSSLDLTLRLLRRSDNTLTHLCLNDRFLTYNEVTSVVGVFSNNSFDLQHLYLEIDYLDVEIFLLLAKSLPRLANLVLVFADLSQTLRSTIYLQNIRSYLADWTLTDIGLYKHRYIEDHTERFSSTEERDLMLRLADVIPSITYIRGQPKLIAQWQQ